MLDYRYDPELLDELPSMLLESMLKENVDTLWVQNVVDSFPMGTFWNLTSDAEAISPLHVCLDKRYCSSLADRMINGLPNTTTTATTTINFTLPREMDTLRISSIHASSLAKLLTKVNRVTSNRRLWSRKELMELISAFFQEKCSVTRLDLVIPAMVSNLPELSDDPRALQRLKSCPITEVNLNFISDFSDITSLSFDFLTVVSRMDNLKKLTLRTLSVHLDGGCKGTQEWWFSIIDAAGSSRTLTEFLLAGVNEQSGACLERLLPLLANNTTVEEVIISDNNCEGGTEDTREMQHKVNYYTTLNQYGRGLARDPEGSVLKFAEKLFALHDAQQSIGSWTTSLLYDLLRDAPDKWSDHIARPVGSRSRKRRAHGDLRNGLVYYGTA
ncbi:expressed unknown protein [Seminavis robusta]|uniref:Uncharacterized protein n=1 Tax=Seminavis robusta TaxID=568900 RepID=A0A9N8F1X4_9STRA|nr:expressed unknown protein [Seminavis robusta]|eukprot:Sro2885_g339350.1 n/a (386) ;mRNA; r:1980-3248